MNKNGEKPDSLNAQTKATAQPVGFATAVGEGVLTRFDKKKKKNKRFPRQGNTNGNEQSTNNEVNNDEE